MKDLAGLLSHNNHLDIYLNHNCNLRCSHCFVGQQLNSMTNMEWSTFRSIVDKAKSVGLNKITLLGGEPTTYPRISDAVDYIYESDIGQVRIVTNGTKPYWHLINSINSTQNLFTIFSIDGPASDIHNKIRGEAVFEILVESIKESKSLGLNIAGITSLNETNYDHIEEIIRFCDKYELEYLNIHKISNTGFASSSDTLGPKKWLDVRQRVLDVSNHVEIPIKFDRKYIKKEDYKDLSDFEKECFVSSERKGNIMIYPDGRIYKCSLFMDRSNNYDYVWRDGAVHKSDVKGSTEASICETCETGCPGVVHKSSQDVNDEHISLCMYRKELIKDGNARVYK